MQLEILYIIEKLSFAIFPFFYKVQRYTFVANEAEKKTTFMPQNPKIGAFLDLKSKYSKVKRKEKHNIVNFGFLPQIGNPKCVRKQ